MSNEVEFVLSQKRKLKLILNDYIYHKHKQCGKKITWRCQHYQKNRCMAHAMTVDDNLVGMRHSHNHVGDTAKVEAAKIYDEIVIEARTTLDEPDVIITNALSECSRTVASEFVNKFSSLKRIIHNIRQELN